MKYHTSNFADFSNNQWQKVWEKMLLGHFVFLSPSPSEQCWGTMSKASIKQCYGFATLYKAWGVILNALFKIPIIFCHWLSEIYKEKERSVRSMLFQITQIYFNRSDYATLHSVMRKMTENGSRMTRKLSQWF